MIGDKSIPISTENGFRYRINQLACMGICTYMTLPYSRRFLNLYALIAVTGLWFITTDLKWLTTRFSKDLVFAMLFFATFIPYALTGTLSYGKSGFQVVIITFPMFFLGMIINHYYMYYKKDFNTLGKIALVSVVMYIIGSIQTYLGLLRFPGASRGLAGAVYRDPSLVALYRNLGIGGFGYVYAACLILIAVVYPLIRKNAKWSGRYRAVSIVAVLVMTIMLLKAAYATAIILILVGLILAMVVKNRRTFIAIMVLATLVLLFFPQQLVGEFLLKFAGLFSGSRSLYVRFTEVAMSFLSDTGGANFSTRSSLYKASLTTFIQHPLFGVYGPFGGGLDASSYSVIGGHSGWLDLLGLYGLFTGFPLFFAMYYNIKKHAEFFKDKISYGSILVTSFLFVVMGFLNPNLTVFEIGFAQFCIVPAIPFLSYAFAPNKQVFERLESVE